MYKVYVCNARFPELVKNFICTIEGSSDVVREGQCFIFNDNNDRIHTVYLSTHDRLTIEPQ